MKALFNLIALVAIANLLIISGLVGYLIFSGKLNADSADKIAAILRGEQLIPASQAATQPTTAPSTQIATTQQAKPFSLDMLEVQQAMLERERRLIEDRYSRVKDAEFKLLKDREAFLQQKKEFYKQVELFQKASKDEGFEKALALYSKMPPKLVKEDFMKLDIDVVVAYLMNMSKMTAAKILKEFKTPEEQKRRQEILEKIRTRRILLGTEPKQVKG